MFMWMYTKQNSMSLRSECYIDMWQLLLLFHWNQMERSQHRLQWGLSMHLLVLWSELLISGKADRQWVYSDSAPSSLCLIVCGLAGSSLRPQRLTGKPSVSPDDDSQNWFQSWICKGSSWITHTHTHTHTHTSRYTLPHTHSHTHRQTKFDHLLTGRCSLCIYVILSVRHVKSAQRSLLGMWPWRLI